MSRRLVPNKSRGDGAAAAAGCAFLVLYGVAVILGLAFWGAVIWGIVELVSWLVTK